MMKKIFTLLVLLICISPFTFSQQEDHSSSLPHEMTPEEMLRKGEIGTRFVSTDPPSGNIRNIAEFEQMEGVLVAYPFGITTSLIAAMSQELKIWTIVVNSSQQQTVTNQYTAAGVNLSNCVWVIAPSDSWWTRDYGPWFVHYGNHELGIVDFPYNRPRPLDDSIPKVVASLMNIPWFGMNLIHTGGNYMTLGTGTSASTDLVVSENPSLTISQIDTLVNHYLGVSTYHKVPDPNNTYIDHIDCWGKYLGPDKVLIRSVPTTHPQYNDIENTALYFASQTSPYGTPFKLYRVYTPNNQPYTNSVILNNRVFVPIMNNVLYDTAALHVYQQALPGYDVQGFTGSWQSTDALHCRAIGLADRGMLEILHNPLLGNQVLLPQYNITAEIYPYSGIGLYPDSTLLFYKINNGLYNSLMMNNLGNNQFEAIIPGQPTGTVISYYIHAVDSASNIGNHPYIGRFDPHVFAVGTVGINENGQNPLQLGEITNVSPNPFRNFCTLEFEIRDLVPVSLEIYTIQGQLIKSIIRQTLGPGKHFFSWDGNNHNDTKVAPGMYYVRLSAGNNTSVRKIIFQGN
jgi:agmatine deiminase